MASRWKERPVSGYAMKTAALVVLAKYPAEASVEFAVTYGSAGEYTGTFVGGGVVSVDPGKDNVKKDVSYTINGVGFIGELISTDPGEANVKSGISYTIESVPKVGTYLISGTGGGGTPPPLLDAGFEQLLSLFGESIVYVPNGGSERTITAIVTRNPAGLVPPTNAYSAPTISLAVRNNASTGISSTEMDAGRDNIKVSQRPGLAAESRPISRVIRVSDVLVHLEVQ